MKNVRFAIQSIHGTRIPEPLAGSGLQPERERRIAAMKRKDSIAASLTGDWLARKLAAELTGCEPAALQIADGLHGKPELPGTPAEISITHSGEYAAAAAALRPVGIDLERLRPLPQTVLLRVCSDEELKWVYADPQQTLPRFFRLWTMKEAYGKMKGVGIFAPHPFCARFVQGTLLELYADCLFLFPEAPEGYSISVCIAREP